eukprot:4133639-Prymnesium_polylepis.2
MPGADRWRMPSRMGAAAARIGADGASAERRGGWQAHSGRARGEWASARRGVGRRKGGRRTVEVYVRSLRTEEEAAVGRLEGLDDAVARDDVLGEHVLDHALVGVDVLLRGDGNETPRGALSRFGRCRSTPCQAREGGVQKTHGAGHVATNTTGRLLHAEAPAAHRPRGSGASRPG